MSSALLSRFDLVSRTYIRIMYMYMYVCASVVNQCKAYLVSV